MKRLIPLILLLCTALACDSGYLESEVKEELVVEGWIENGHAPFVLVSSTLPVSSDPRPLSEITKHILRYANVYIDCDGKRYYLTARLTDKYILQNYFTSNELRGEVGKTYKLHVDWEDYRAEAYCTIPEPVQIDSCWYEKQYNDSSYVVKIKFTNEVSQCNYYQSFNRFGAADSSIFNAVNFTTLDGSLLGGTVTETFMKPETNAMSVKGKDLYFHSGDILAVKLATIERPIYDFWNSYANMYNGSSVLTAPVNLKGNVDGAIGYWAGYGISIAEIKIE